MGQGQSAEAAVKGGELAVKGAQVVAKGMSNAAKGGLIGLAVFAVVGTVLAIRHYSKEKANDPVTTTSPPTSLPSF